jgi:hypothetical protein
MQKHGVGLVVLAIVGIMGLVALVLLSKHMQLVLK